MEDLVTIRKKRLSITFPMDPLLILKKIGIFDTIKKKLMFHNIRIPFFFFQFRIDSSWIQTTIIYIIPRIVR